MSDDYRVREVLSQMAWERAKGELQSILATFWTEEDEYQEMKELIDEFINKVENESPLA